MPWTPTLYSSSRPLLVKNLLAYIAANDTDALAWAKTQLGYVGTVVDFAAVYNSAEGRMLTTFPHLMLVRQATEIEPPNDDYSLHVQHSLGFEIEIAGTSPSTLQELSDVYLLALQSMIWKCPFATLTAGMLTDGHPTVNVTEVDADQTRGKPPQFLQTPTLVATIELIEVRS